jgi:hypothetical protein
MARSIIVFGNGLGMALDGAYFRLAAGLETVWQGSQHFTQDHKLMVATAVPGVNQHVYPQSEAQLDQLQMAIVASDFLRSFETPQVSWLSDASREFPQAFRAFIHEVAAYFHESSLDLPDSFVTPLANFLSNTKSHVGVLNYDNLLYDAFRRTGITNGYSGSLLDGYRSDGFSPDYMERFNPSRHGWYLHLHGSPLFVDQRKLMGGDRAFLEPTDQCHIVLTHVAHKPSIIDASPVLSEYWRRLDQAIDEASQVILFGYSGEDIHLNDKLRSRCGGKRVHVIEWSGAGSSAARIDYWANRLKGCHGKLHHFDNILDFQGWSSL